MNEKLQYASMLEMPISSANVSVKPSKKKRRSKKVDTEAVKQQLIEKVNSDNFEQEDQSSTQPNQLLSPIESELDNVYGENETATVKPVRTKRKRTFKVSVIAIQFVVIGVLMATIFLTSALNANSGINVFFRNVFGSDNTEVLDSREYTDFTPVISMDTEDFFFEDGVLTLNSSASVYSSCDGQISSITADGNGKYSVEIEHSSKFKSVIGGLDFVYGEVGQKVYSNLPVGYADNEGATMCFMGLDGVIANFSIVDNTVVWAV